MDGWMDERSRERKGESQVKRRRKERKRQCMQSMSDETVKEEQSRQPENSLGERRDEGVVGWLHAPRIALPQLRVCVRCGPLSVPSLSLSLCLSTSLSVSRLVAPE